MLKLIKNIFNNIFNNKIQERQKRQKRKKKKKRTLKKEQTLIYGIVVGYNKKSIKVELKNKKIKNISIGITPPYEEFFPIRTKVPIRDNAVWGSHKPKIFKKYPNKSALEIQKILSKKEKYKNEWWVKLF